MLETAASAYRKVMTWRMVTWYAAGLVLSSIVARFLAIDFWAGIAPNEKDALGLMWQVHAAVISIGFTGLAITFQLVADPQLSPGPARRAVIREIRFGQLLTLGVASDIAIGLTAVWFYSDANVFLMFMFGFVPSILAIAVTYAYSAHLFARPHVIERLTTNDLIELVRVNATSIAEVRRKNRLLEEQIGKMTSVSMNFWINSVKPDHWFRYFGKPGVISEISVAAAQQLASLLSSIVPDENIQPGDKRPIALIRVRIGDKVASGSPLFQLFGTKGVNPAKLRQLESLGSRLVTVASEAESPGDIIARDLGDLQEVLIAAITAKRYPSIERGFQHYKALVSVIREVVDSTGGDGAPTWSFDSDWSGFNRQIWEINDVAASSGPRIAIEATEATFGRCSDALASKDIGFFATAVRSYSHIWSRLLSDPIGNEDALEHLLISLQNLTEWRVPHKAAPSNKLTDAFIAASLEAWMGILRSAFEASDERWASRALGYQSSLYRFSSKEKPYRGKVQQALLVVLAWLLYRQEERELKSGGGVRKIVITLRENAARSGADLLHDIAAAYAAGVDGPLRRWESEDSLPSEMRQIRSTEFLAKAGLLAFAAYPYVQGSAVSREMFDFASSALGYVDSLKEIFDPEWPIKQEYLGTAGTQLEKVVKSWRSEVRENLRKAKLDEKRLAEFMGSLSEELLESSPLVEVLSVDTANIEPVEPLEVQGRKITAPKWFLVESDVVAEPVELGHLIGDMIRREHEMAALRRLLSVGLSRTLPLSKVLRRIANWESGADHPIVLIFNSFDAASYLNFDEKNSVATVEGKRIRAHQLFVSNIDEHVALVDISKAPRLARWPEGKEGLTPIEGAKVAVGVTDEGKVDSSDDATPLVTVEFGSLVQWTSSEQQGVEFLRIADLVEEE